MHTTQSHRVNWTPTVREISNRIARSPAILPLNPLVQRPLPPDAIVRRQNISEPYFQMRNFVDDFRNIPAMQQEFAYVVAIELQDTNNYSFVWRFLDPSRFYRCLLIDRQRTGTERSNLHRSLTNTYFHSNWWVFRYVRMLLTVLRLRKKKRWQFLCFIKYLYAALSSTVRKITRDLYIAKSFSY